MTTPILLLNCGSSSIKYQMIDADTEEVLAVGLVQKIGDAGTGTIEHEVNDTKSSAEQHFADHEDAIAAVVALFAEHGPDLSQAVAVGHRIVHGGETFHRPTLIDDTVIDKIVAVSGLAPLHNPPAISGIRAAMHILPDVPHVAIFDTAFFSELPPEASTYAIDTTLAHAHHIRKYGFHGTSHSYVSKKTAEVLGRDLADLRTITCHLGNGASVSAIKGGHAIDTSMGLTPLQGLVMGTRSGDIDPGIHAFLSRELGMGLDEVDTLLNKKSGMLGLTGFTDMRDIEARMNEGDHRAKLGMAVYVHRLVGYIGSYIAHLGGVDALVFTAGVGENASTVRRMVCDKLAPLGFLVDADANRVRSREPRVISTPDSPVTVLVVPTNEELAMARETLATISGR
ncbi:MAG TPA: acetate kinase, partial [Propionibacteriaceae bacterium]|nr:acetate kinase [Propionibacteriaceae bacterium]